jgi:hypothetical protein
VDLLICIIQNIKFGKCHAKVHGKVYAGTGHEGPMVENRYSSTPSLTSGLEVGGCSKLYLSHFTCRKETRCQLYRRQGGRKSGLDGCRKSPSPGLPTRSESQYRLSYPSPRMCQVQVLIKHMFQLCIFLFVTRNVNNLTL